MAGDVKYCVSTAKYFLKPGIIFRFQKVAKQKRDKNEVSLISLLGLNRVFKRLLGGRPMSV